MAPLEKPLRRDAAPGKRNRSALALIPAFSPGEKEKRSQPFAANPRWDWFKCLE